MRTVRRLPRALVAFAVVLLGAVTGDHTDRMAPPVLVLHLPDVPAHPVSLGLPDRPPFMQGSNSRFAFAEAARGHGEAFDASAAAVKRP
jgi:hypothetical protein